MQDRRRPLPRRKSIRLKDYDYSQPGAYFVNACVHTRACILGSIESEKMVLSNIGDLVQDLWTRLPHRFPNIALDSFVVMPNHFHGLIVIDSAQRNMPTDAEEQRPTLGDMMRAFKSQAAVESNRLLARPLRPFWQVLYYDHVVRNEQDLNRIREYIQTNVASWALDMDNPDCRRPGDLELWIRGLMKKPRRRREP